MEVAIGVIFILFVIAKVVFSKEGGSDTKGIHEPHKRGTDDDIGYPPSYYH